jgi:hypothetical protein
LRFGYRTSTQVGHHIKTIESLELTITADPKIIRTLKTLNNKRNKTFYDVAGAVSDQDLKQTTKIAIELQNQVTLWLKKSHHDLLKG